MSDKVQNTTTTLLRIFSSQSHTFAITYLEEVDKRKNRSKKELRTKYVVFAVLLLDYVFQTQCIESVKEQDKD